jgi:hypothetical protein
MSRTHLKGAVTKEDGFGGQNGLKRAKEGEEPRIGALNPGKGDRARVVAPD